MKKLDRLVLKTFFSPFFLVLFVVIFVLLLQKLIPYLEDIVGKNVGVWQYIKLISSFGVFMVPLALPITILMSSLMAFGNLGEHFELTAIKSSGISLLRVMRPIFFFSLIMVVVAFLMSNYLAPKAALQAFSTLWNIKQTSAAFELKEGEFYNGLGNYSIKANKIYKDGKSIKGLYIYDHTAGAGNIDVILADSGRMYTIADNQYLVMELYDGHQYSKSSSLDTSSKYVVRSEDRIEPYYRRSFDSTKMVMDMSNFNPSSVPADAFKNNRHMKTVAQLRVDIDSMYNRMLVQDYRTESIIKDYYQYSSLHTNINVGEEAYLASRKKDSIRYLKDSLSVMRVDSIDAFAALIKKDSTKKDSVMQYYRKKEGAKYYNKDNEMKMASLKPKLKKTEWAAMKQLQNREMKYANIKEEDLKKAYEEVHKKRFRNNATKLEVFTYSLDRAKNVSNLLESQVTQEEDLKTIYIKTKLEQHKKFSLALACISMFLIGAPLGAIIKKGGLGVPLMIAIFFFTVFYVLLTNGEKLAKEGEITPWAGAWACNYVLFPVGVWFLKKAKDDARLLESDAYAIFFSKVKIKLQSWFSKNK